MSGYSHKQTAPLCLVLYGVSLASFLFAGIAKGTPGLYIASGVGLLIALMAAAFHHLAVDDRGEVLRIAFGPIRVFQRTVRYSEITQVEVGRTLLSDSWGIHMSRQGGWVWNMDATASLSICKLGYCESVPMMPQIWRRF
ncbi:MAG: hypothetical protein NT069_35210 [Planctomycetota bacterium]|nr:hypothetical protein [Planctomycetota bacterium]